MRGVAYCLIRQRPEYPWVSIVQGLKNAGYEVRTTVASSISPDDLLVTWTPWEGSLSNRLGEQHRAHGGRWIVFENGYIPNDKNDQRYYCAGLNGYNGLGDHCNGNSPRDRFDELSRPLADWRADGNHIVLVGQMGGVDTRYTMPLDWLDDIIHRITAVSDRPIHYIPKRMRPQYPTKTSARVLMPNETLHEAFVGAWAVVTFNSKCVMEAMLCGIPAFYDGKNSIAGEWVCPGIDDIESPKLFDRTQLFSDVAYAQWNTREILAGKPFEKLCPVSKAAA